MKERRFRKWRRPAVWTAFVLLLVGIGWALDIWLPPEPRWNQRGQFDGAQVVPAGVVFPRAQTKTEAWGVGGGAGWRNGDRQVQKQALPETPLTLLDLHTGETIGTFFARRRAGMAWVCSPDGRYLAAEGAEGILWIAD